MHRTNLRILTLTLLLFVFSCAEDENSLDNVEEHSNTSIEKINLPEHLNLDSGEVKMFTMPTPLQIATALKIMHVDYNDHLLLKSNEVSGDDIKLSLLLGMYLTDLGYTTVYNNTQKSLGYAKDVQSIMEELPISYYVNDVFQSRFKNNIDNQDSLCKIILEGYNDANQYISETENEGLGLLILTGGYVEGLFLITSSDISNVWLEEHNNILIQQKMFLDNFLVLLEGYTSNNRIATVVNKLSELKVAFDKFEIYFDNDLESYELRGAITPAIREEINSIITDIRSNIITSV